MTTQVSASSSLAEELMRLKQARDSAQSLREMAEWCVEIEEAMGGRPPTRPFATRSDSAIADGAPS